jgi:hypothetical protein
VITGKGNVKGKVIVIRRAEAGRMSFAACRAPIYAVQGALDIITDLLSCIVAD